MLVMDVNGIGKAPPADEMIIVKQYCFKSFQTLFSATWSLYSIPPAEHCEAAKDDYVYDGYSYSIWL